MAEPAGQKTEKPTPKKRREARKKGLAARSSELPQAVALVVTAIMLPFVLPGFFTRIAESWRTAISAEVPRDPEVAVSLLGVLAADALRTFLPLVAMSVGASLLAQFVLVGDRPNPYKLKPQWKNLNPVSGIKRFFSLQILWDFLRTLTKLLILAIVGWTLWSRLEAEILGGGRSTADTLLGLSTSMRDLFIRMAAAAILVGVADAAFNKQRFLKQIKMTKQEVKDEMKQQETSPEVRGEIRRRQMALSRNRMIAAVAEADVVVTNPTHLAIALGYDPDDGAPRVLAKGQGLIADRIREEARKHSVPIREDKPLARAMFRGVEVGDLLPAEFYAAVAAILASIYRARRRTA
ncbi:MAG: EscU/YscU/HrcU family type III secretion system export apparatus switch protein [Actinomycetota bacterium]